MTGKPSWEEGGFEKLSGVQSEEFKVRKQRIETMDPQINEKHERMKEVFRTMGKVLVAYSGGVDSTLLLGVAQDTLDRGNVLAVTSLSPLYPERELDHAKKVVQSVGAKHLLVESNELEIKGFSKNPSNRCYFCKKELFKKLSELAKTEGIHFIVEGSTLDDDKDHRPGSQAIKELGIRSPLKEVGFTKLEVRELSKALGLPTWDKPSFACLASRFPYGEEITAKALEMVAESEDFLFGLGFKQVRVRHYGNLARIEILKDEMKHLMKGSLRDEVVSHLKGVGYKYVTLDLQGFRSGSMNEVL